MSRSAHLDDLLRAVERHDWATARSLACRLERGVLEPETLRGPAVAEHRDQSRGSSGPATATARAAVEAPARVVLVTGAAGFIGSHLARRLLSEGDTVIGFDDFNDYYDPVCKFENTADLLRHDRFDIHEGDIRDLGALRALFASWPITHIVHLAARAGVRPSIRDPQLYVTTNVLGTQNLLEMARQARIAHFVYASSSSVYGGSTEFPFSEQQVVDHPVSPYAATKKANEVQASCYGRLYSFPVTGLRFFTVYGPGGRPDMAIRAFIETMDRGEAVPMFGDGGFERDFTYVDDIVDGIVRALRAGDGRSGWDEVFNLGESDTTSVRELILLIAKELGKSSTDRPVKDLSSDDTAVLVEGLVRQGLVRRMPEQAGDVPKTYANVDKARARLGYAPATRIADGIRKTVAWHRARASAASDPAHSALQRSIRAYASGRKRTALDGMGQPRDPGWRQRDVDELLRTVVELHGVQWAAADSCLARRIEAGHLALVVEASAYLGGIPRQAASECAAGGRPASANPSGLDGLAVHRDRLRIVSMLRASASGGIRPSFQDELLALAKRVVARVGERPTVLAVDATSYRRGALNDGGSAFSRDGDTSSPDDDPILCTIRQFLPFTNSVVLFTTDSNEADLRATIAQSKIESEPGRSIRYVCVRAPALILDDAGSVLEETGGVIVLSPARGQAGWPDVIANILLLQQALGDDVPMIVPCSQEVSAGQPLVLAERGPDRGRVVGCAQHPGRRGQCLRTTGIIAMQASAIPTIREGQCADSRRRPGGQPTGRTSRSRLPEPEPALSIVDHWLNALCSAGADVAALCIA